MKKRNEANSGKNSMGVCLEVLRLDGEVYIINTIYAA